MKSLADANRELIRDAASISRDIDAVVADRVSVVAAEMQVQMFSFLNLALEAIGIDRNRALQVMNAQMVHRNNVLSADEFSMLVNTYRQVNTSKAEQEAAIDQNSRTALDFAGQAGGVVKDAA